MRWQRGARYGVAGVGLAVAAAVYLASRKPAPPPADLKPIIVDQNAIEQGGRGTTYRLFDGRRRGEVEHESWAKFADGRTLFFKARLHIVEEQVVDIWADVIETAGRPAQGTETGRVELQGHVRVVTADGLEVKTERARYEDDTGRVTIQGPFTYTQGRITGRGVDGQYERLERILTIADQAQATVAPGAPGETTTEATAKSMTLVRASRQLRLEHGAKIVRQAETLAANTAVLFFTEDEQYVRRAELRGQSSVTPAGAPGPASPPAMRADDIDLTLHDGGQVLKRAQLFGRTAPASMVTTDASGESAIKAAELDAELARDGATLVRLDAKRGSSGKADSPREQVVVNLPPAANTPAREVRGDSLTARGAPDKGLQTARFDGSVVFIEQTDASAGKSVSRRATSATLDLGLDGRLSAVKQADFQGVATFRDGPTTATAGQAIYDGSKRTLSLRPTTREPALPHAVTNRVTVDAKEIDVWLDSQDLDARQDVKALITEGKDGRTTRATALFDPTKTVTGTAVSLRYRGGQARFEGGSGTPAVLSQEESTVQGDVVTLTPETNALAAERRVVAKFTLAAAREAAGAAAPAPVAYEITADSLAYDDASRTAVSKGSTDHRAKLTSRDGTIESNQIDFTLAAASRTLKGFVAIEQVDVVLPEESGRATAAKPGSSARLRRGAGDRLEYTAAGEQYVLIGKPSAAVVAPNTDDEKCSRWDGPRLVFGRAADSKNPPSGWSNFVNDSSCTAAIR
jgi:lipopolysaccharide export system protein LptA